MLASALKLTGPVQEAFVAAARGRADPARVLAVRSEAAPESSAAAATRTLPRDIGGFTGREGELTGLENSLAKVGWRLGGHLRDRRDGWHWQDDVRRARSAPAFAGRFPRRAVLPPAARAHRYRSVARRPGRMPWTSLLDETAGVAVQHIPPGLEARAAKWRDQYVAGKQNPAAPRRRCRAPSKCRPLRCPAVPPAWCWSPAAVG